MTTVNDRSLVGVQALRGLAAMLVVLCHAGQMVNERLGAGIQPLTFGASGVDLFFPISGFVMAVTTHKLWGEAGHAGNFLLRRLARIVPLYWSATALKLVLLLALPTLSSRTALDAWHVAASFLFIPAWDADHRALPVISVGWTLHFEMLFYALFAVALWWRMHPVWFVGVTLVALSCLPVLEPLGAVGTLANSILLEFVAGMFIGWAYARGRRLPRGLAITTLILALIAIPASHVVADDQAFVYRVLLWGAPGALALAAVLSLESEIRRPLSGLPQRLGDASYAIYLTHGFVLPPLGLLLLRLNATGPAWTLLAIAAACVLSAVLGIWVHQHAEAPVTAYLNRKLRQRQDANRKLPASAASNST